MATKPIPEGYSAVTPYVIARDVDRLLQFVQKAFGAKVVDAHRDGPTLLERLGRDPDIFEQVVLVGVAPELVAYITDIVSRTRAHAAVYLGASPRASIGLLTSGRVRAAAEGRDFVTPDDVKALAPCVLRHRLMLQPDAELEGMSPDDVIDSILKEAPVPKTVA